MINYLLVRQVGTPLGKVLVFEYGAGGHSFLTAVGGEEEEEEEEEVLSLNRPES